MSSQENKFIFKISNDYPTLAIGELEELLNTNLTKISNLQKGFFKGNLTSENSEKITKLGLTKSIFRIVKTINSTNITEIMNNLNSKNIESDFKISSFSENKNNPTTIQLAEKIHNLVPDNKVNLTNPEHNYNFIFDENQTYFCEKIFSNEDSTNDRRSHLRAINHPTSTHPKIAKAMINLANTDSFIDPFCGAGGLLIEGILMNLKTKGSDISFKMIESAKENLEALNLNCEVKIKDALNYTKEETSEYNAIISDLPFGKNSILSKNLNSLYEEFFVLAQTLTDKLIIGFESNIDLKKLISKTDWTIKKEFEYYVHKSMSRKIVKLEKK